MKWETRVPEAWADILAWSNRKTFCATTDRGEYAIQQGNNGKFAVLLDGVSVTSFSFDTATEAMEAAKKEDGKLAEIM